MHLTPLLPENPRTGAQAAILGSIESDMTRSDLKQQQQVAEIFNFSKSNLSNFHMICSLYVSSSKKSLLSQVTRISVFF